MTKKIKNIVSVFMIALLFNSCGNSSECVNWEEYHEDIDFDDLDFSVHSNIEEIMNENTRGDEEIIDGLLFVPIYKIELPSVQKSSSIYGYVDPEDIVYDADFKYILRKDGDLFTGCIVSRGSHYKFENGLLVSWEEYLLTWEESETDTLLHKMQFKNGLPSEKWFTKHVNYNRDNSIESIVPKAEGEFLNGNRHGKWKQYSTYLNELEKTLDYDNGKFHGNITYIDYQSSSSTVLTTKRYYQNGLVTEKKWGNFVKDERAKKVINEYGRAEQVYNDSLFLNKVKVYDWIPNEHYENFQIYYNYFYNNEGDTLNSLVAYLYVFADKDDYGVDDSTLLFNSFPAGEIITRDKYFTDHTNYDREHLSKMVDPKLLKLDE